MLQNNTTVRKKIEYVSMKQSGCYGSAVAYISTSETTAWQYFMFSNVLY